VFDEVIKSETSFHCTICNKCVEYYDHHCPFINNCLGAKNHKYFLVFIVSYTLFIIFVLIGTVWHLINMYHQYKFKCFTEDLWTTVLFILIVLHLPIVLFQLKEQCKGLAKKPVLSKLEQSNKINSSIRIS